MFSSYAILHKQYGRNKWVWDKANGSIFGVRAAATNLLHDWQEAQVCGLNSNSQGTVSARRWQKPPDGWVIVNIDAAIFQNGSIGFGMCDTNSQGQFQRARCRRIDGAWQPREAEALSLKEALSWVKDLQLSHCMFQSDSKVLVNACNGKAGEAYFGTIVLDCVQLLKHINHVLVEFIYRSANSVAHLLAQAAYSMSDLGSGMLIHLILLLMYLILILFS
nr:PREDICTED: uncharacterized protein LOC108199532 isoform X2 [Daucus carota subsp. sativus]